MIIYVTPSVGALSTKVTFVPADWCALVLIEPHLISEESTPQMKKYPRMSIMVNPALGSL